MRSYLRNSSMHINFGTNFVQTRIFVPTAKPVGPKLRKSPAKDLKRILNVLERSDSDIYRQVENKRIEPGEDGDDSFHPGSSHVTRIRVMLGDESGRARHQADPARQTTGVKTETHKGCEYV